MLLLTYGNIILSPKNNIYSIVDSVKVLVNLKVNKLLFLLRVIHTFFLHKDFLV